MSTLIRIERGAPWRHQIEIEDAGEFVDLSEAEIDPTLRLGFTIDDPLTAVPLIVHVAKGRFTVGLTQDFLDAQPPGFLGVLRVYLRCEQTDWDRKLAAILHLYVQP